MKSPATLKMTITPTIEKMLKGEPLFLEIEMLQGTKFQLQDGMIQYEIEIEDEGKGELIKEFILHCIANSQQKIISN